jgi:uncharacterized membrane-anchored protein
MVGPKKALLVTPQLGKALGESRANSLDIGTTSIEAKREQLISVVGTVVIGAYFHVMHHLLVRWSAFNECLVLLGCKLRQLA